MNQINKPPGQSETAAEERFRQQSADARAQAGEAADKASEAAADLKEGTRQAAQQAGDYVVNMVRDRKSMLADQIDEYRDAARAAIDKLQDEQHGAAASRIDRAASGLDRISSYLREREPETMFNDASEYARRHPEVTFGGLFLAGLGIARFLKASDRPSRRMNRDYEADFPRAVSPASGYSPAYEPVYKPVHTPVSTPGPNVPPPPAPPGSLQSDITTKPEVPGNE